MGRQDDPRAGYIAVATRQFAAQGYHGTSLAALAREAGVSKQALLHFFSTKERLYAEVLAALATRQCEGIEAAARPDPAEHLLAYFQGLREAALERPEDARLVVRALLDSHEGARVWPMKDYLDRLVALVRQTQDGRDLPEAAALARVFSVIGAIQYLAISAPALSGMYGKDAADRVAAEFDGLMAGALAGVGAAR